MMLSSCAMRFDCGPIGRVFLADDAAPTRSALAHPGRVIDGGMGGLSCDYEVIR